MGQRFEDQFAHVDVVKPVVEIEIVTLPFEIGREGRPLVDQLAKVGDVGRTGEEAVASLATSLGLSPVIAFAVVRLEEGADDAVGIERDERPPSAWSKRVVTPSLRTVSRMGPPTRASRRSCACRR
jgi:hypothetical protein